MDINSLKFNVNKMIYKAAIIVLNENTIGIYYVIVCITVKLIVIEFTQKKCVLVK